MVLTQSHVLRGPMYSDCILGPACSLDVVHGQHLSLVTLKGTLEPLPTIMTRRDCNVTCRQSNLMSHTREESSSSYTSIGKCRLASPPDSDEMACAKQHSPTLSLSPVLHPPSSLHKQQRQTPCGPVLKTRLPGAISPPLHRKNQSRPGWCLPRMGCGGLTLTFV